MKQLGYLGWHGFGNFGDDLLRLCWERALEGHVQLVDAPLGPKDWRRTLKALLHRLTRRTDMLLLGGGTVLGFRNWHRFGDGCSSYRTRSKRPPYPGIVDSELDRGQWRSR
jgi:hypothetical protein